MPSHFRIATAIAGVTLLASACAPPPSGGPTPTAAPSPNPPSSVTIAGPISATALTGRLLIITPTTIGASPSLSAINVANGQSTALWPIFEPDEAGFNAHDWALAPDGQRIAYLRKGGTGDVRIVVRELTPGGVRHDYTPGSGGTADVLLWLPDGSGLVYGALDVAENAESVAKVTRWSLRQLDLAAGKDKAVMTLDEAALGGTFPRLAGYDAEAGRAAVLTGPGENFYVDGIRLFDTSTGLQIATIKARDEGFQAVASPDGRSVAYGDCQGCQQGAGGVVKLLEVASGRVHDVATLDLGGKVVALRWSLAGEALAWTTYDQGHPRPGDNHSLSGARQVDSQWDVASFNEPSGSTVAISPDGRTLLGTGGAYDMATGVHTALPWALPGGLAWDEASWRVVGWVPDSS